VAGQTANCLKAFANLKRICEENLAGRYQIAVVALPANPRLAAGDEIVAIPTLVRKLPTPVRKIIGRCLTPSGCWWAFSSDHAAAEAAHIAVMERGVG